MALPQIIEGTWEEIKQHDAALAGHRLRVIVDPVEEDFTIGLPDPPNTIRDAAHLEELLLEGIRSGPATPMTDADWNDIRQEVITRAALRNRLSSNNA